MAAVEAAMMNDGDDEMTNDGYHEDSQQAHSLLNTKKINTSLLNSSIS